MKTLKLLMLAPLVIATAATAQSPGRDGYYFTPSSQAPNLTPQITFVVHSSTEDLRRAMPASAQVVEGRRIRVRAWSELKDGKCIVHLIDPMVLYSPELIGHEVAHCVYGQFHS